MPNVTDMTSASARASRPQAHRAAAFTLVELLVVLFILSILVSLAVSVGWIVVDKAKGKETAAIQAIVMEAVQAYYEDQGEYPSGNAKSLLTALKGNSAAKEKLRDLPAKALDKADNAIRDAYGEEMAYEKEGGIGGTTPVLISKGPDREMGTGDDIRSDGSQE